MGYEKNISQPKEEEACIVTELNRILDRLGRLEDRVGNLEQDIKEVQRKIWGETIKS